MRYVALCSLALFAGCVGSPCHCTAADPCPVVGTDCKCGCQDGKPCTCQLVKADAKPTIVDRQQKVCNTATGLPANGWDKNVPDDGDYGYWKDGVLLSRYCPQSNTYRAFCSGEYGPAVPGFDKYASPNVPCFPVVNAFFGGGCPGGCCGGRCR